MVTDAAPGDVTVLVGGVSELFQSDLDLGRLAVTRLQAEELGPGVAVEDLHYGAVAVAQRLEELRPGTLVLISAVARGRVPGAVERRRVDPPRLKTADVQAAVGDAVTGYVHPDLVVEIAAALEVLPERTVAIEVEPEATGSGEGLSAAAAVGLEEALALARTEVRRSPVLQLAAELSLAVAGERLEPSRAVEALRALLGELSVLDREGRWGQTFAYRDRFKRAIAGSQGSEGMEHRDWALWWALIEELDRLEVAEAVEAD